MFIKRVRFNREEIKTSDTYIATLPLFENIEALDFSVPVTFLAGDNGTGKSTLIEALALSLGFTAEGGSKNFYSENPGEYSDMYKCITLEKGPLRPKDSFYFRADRFYDLASRIDRIKCNEYYGGESLHAQSHGEGFLSVMGNRLFGKGIYLLDEPESSLSPMNQITLLTMINDLVKNGSQLIIATHSPILLAYPEAEILFIENDGVERIDYEETEHYRTSKLFLDNYKGFLKSLFKPD